VHPEPLRTGNPEPSTEHRSRTGHAAPSTANSAVPLIAGALVIALSVYLSVTIGTRLRPLFGLRV